MRSRRLIAQRTERHDILNLSQSMLPTSVPEGESLRFSFDIPRERPRCTCDLDARRALPPSAKVRSIRSVHADLVGPAR